MSICWGKREIEFKKGARGQSFMGQKKVLRIVKDFKMHQLLVIVFFLSILRIRI